jgi:RNA polymerase sigma-70 factor, ECF subfamily
MPPSKNPSKPVPGEADFVERARKSDKDAYRVLVEAYQDRVFGMVFSMVRNREHAEDLTQEIFVKAFFALGSFKGDSTFYTWIYRIASNTCLDFLRKRRLPEVSLDQNYNAEDDLLRKDTLPAPASELPDAPLESEGDVVRLLEELSPDHRLVLTLREAQGYAYEEMADILKCNVNTIKSKLNRAREALKKAYEAKYGPPHGGAGHPPDSVADGNISTQKIVENSEETV